jgi:16S rRNA (uracil1498-N3)-methyltransferase
MTRRRWIADSWNDSSASLLGPQSDHLARVLRAQPGTAVDVVAGGRVYNAIISSVTKDEVRFDLVAEISAEAALPVTLMLAIFKFDHMEWAIEKAVELGVAAIQPVIARRTEKHLAQAADKRVERWRRLAHEAAKQSRRADIPAVESPIALPIHLKRESAAHRILLAENERNTTLRERIELTLNTEQLTTPAYEFAIGPEGGWTSDELALFAERGWLSASLGPRILRAETAAIASLAIALSIL